MLEREIGNSQEEDFEVIFEIGDDLEIVGV